MVSTIFLQIAAYRDPELEPTLRDALARAANPTRLRFGICRQYHPGDGFDTLAAYRDDERFRIRDVLYSKTKGVCWARHLVQGLYQAETYTLQLDSHMRFAQDWDATLIDMLEGLRKDGFPKPLITAYVPSYNPANDPAGRVQEPWRMNFDRFIPEGAVFFMPEVIPNWSEVLRPIRARFYSAHFAFADGAFSEEVRHDPQFYFHGEEISIAARAYTHGYDLFHPHRVVAWHEYTRKGRVKHWDDADDWEERNRVSHASNRDLFKVDGGNAEGQPRYGFGSQRTLREYEEYAGLLFRNRHVQQYTLDRKPPPNPGPADLGGEAAWLESFVPRFRHCIDLYKGAVAESDYDFWTVAIHGADDDTLYREDLPADRIAALLEAPGDFAQVWVDFDTPVRPAYWVVWPHSHSKGWCERHTGSLRPA